MIRRYRRTSSRGVIKRRVVVKRRVSIKSGRRIRMRGGRTTKDGGVRHSIKIQSAGFEAGNYARIYHNGKRVRISRAGRGLNIFAWTSSWKEIGGKAYDTYGRTNHGLEKDFSRLPAGAIIAVACKDECSRKLSSSMQKIFVDMGSKEVLKLGMREPWAFVGIKGKRAMSEMRKDRKTRVQAGRTWIIRTRTVTRRVIRRVKRVVVRRRISMKTNRRIRIRGGRSVSGGGIRHSIKV